MFSLFVILLFFTLFLCRGFNIITAPTCIIAYFDCGILMWISKGVVNILWICGMLPDEAVLLSYFGIRIVSVEFIRGSTAQELTLIPGPPISGTFESIIIMLNCTRFTAIARCIKWWVAPYAMDVSFAFDRFDICVCYSYFAILFLGCIIWRHGADCSVWVCGSAESASGVVGSIGAGTGRGDSVWFYQILPSPRTLADAQIFANYVQTTLSPLLMAHSWSMWRFYQRHQGRGIDAELC